MLFTHFCILVYILSINASPIYYDGNFDDSLRFYDGLGGEFGEYFEGDMLLTSTQERDIFEASEGRNGLRNGAKRWPNRTVVYHIEEDDFDKDEIKVIKEGMMEIENKSCIKFRRRNANEHAVIFKSSANGCFSNVGFSNDDDEETEQVLNLGKGCMRHGTVVHEMLHTLGFYHMQSTYDRDDYIKIVWENIKEGTEHNFAKYNNDTVTDFGVPYDYGSVMHYPEKAFSKNGNKTIITLQENVHIGQRNEMSVSDVQKLNKMYCEDSEEEKLDITHRNS
ncbi:seminal metalloprotease 1-like [Achroia grisella]|uniref:seminal metalloprotease 1-like n=1 Tax=Achroia grisella TaxID=688607 RepID=UPI0027D22662|nr:seminal metalloprotease 1-like [Achroia grisella]